LNYADIITMAIVKYQGTADDTQYAVARRQLAYIGVHVKSAAYTTN